MIGRLELVDRNMEYHVLLRASFIRRASSGEVIKLAMSETLKFNIPVYQSCLPIMSMFNQFSTEHSLLELPCSLAFFEKLIT